MQTASQLNEQTYQQQVISYLVQSGLLQSQDQQPEGIPSPSNQKLLHSLSAIGLHNSHHIYHNLSVANLVEHALIRGEGQLSANGALCVTTGKYTGRSPHDRFVVSEPGSRHEVDWNDLNQPMSEADFERLHTKVIRHLNERDLYVFDGFVGADPRYRFGVRVVNELAWQNLFVHQLFQRPTETELDEHQADFLVLAAPSLRGNPATDGTHSEAFIVLHLTKRIVLIGGTYYAGEMKKSIFSMMNYIMTKRDVLPMHGAANLGQDGHTALFFGLSGTGKTTLSADPDRRLIGDDEHGWSADGIFNFEGGCYAKTIRLSPEQEPQIWSAIRFGALLENVVFDPETRLLDYNDASRTENTRVAYPLEHIDNAELSGLGNHPKTILFLTADAFGVLPPIARLTREQAMFHFLSGYTSKLAGTERGITQPTSTFSACFGQCFFPLPPTVYAEMLGDLLEQHPDTQVYLVNTGWSGGGYGVGQRISIHHTRALVSAALNGSLDQVEYVSHPIFKILVPTHVPGVPTEMLNPELTWPSADAYNQQAQELARQFVQNFQQFNASEAIRSAMPNPG